MQRGGRDGSAQTPRNRAAGDGHQELGNCSRSPEGVPMRFSERLLSGRRLSAAAVGVTMGTNQKHRGQCVKDWYSCTSGMWQWGQGVMSVGYFMLVLLLAPRPLCTGPRHIETCRTA